MRAPRAAACPLIAGADICLRNPIGRPSRCDFAHDVHALLHHLATTLLTSRLQRDLTDSSTLRNVGSAFGYAVVALHALLHGLNQVAVAPEALTADLDTCWAVLAEAVQTVMRKHGCAQPYEQLKALTRGHAITREEMQAFIRSLDLPADEQERLLRLTPATYIGRASQLVRHMGAVVCGVCAGGGGVGEAGARRSTGVPTSSHSSGTRFG